MRAELAFQGKSIDVAISLCMIVKNESKTLERCLKSVSGIVQEIVIGDTGSTDNTIQIAKKYGAKVVDVEWTDDFSHARNQVLMHASSDWILHLDADEELAADSFYKFSALFGSTAEPEISHRPEGSIQPKETTQPEVLTKPVESTGIEIAYYLNITDTATAEKFGAIRLFKNDPGLRYKGMIHEAIDFGDKLEQPRYISGSEIEIIHHGYEKNVVDEKAKQGRNSKLVLAALKADPEDPKNNYYYGHLLDIEGRFDEAITYYKKSVRYDIKKTFPAAIRSLVMLFEQVGRLDEGLQAAGEGIQDHPDFTDLYYLTGLLLMRAGRLPEAVKYFEEATRLGPPPISYPSYRNISEILSVREAATCYRLMGNEDQALKLYMSVLAQNGSDIFAAKGCAAILCKQIDRTGLTQKLKEITDLDEEMISKIVMEQY